jgi:hypothetical protein
MGEDDDEVTEEPTGFETALHKWWRDHMRPSIDDYILDAEYLFSPDLADQEATLCIFSCSSDSHYGTHYIHVRKDTYNNFSVARWTKDQ